MESTGRVRWFALLVVGAAWACGQSPGGEEDPPTATPSVASVDPSFAYQSRTDVTTSSGVTTDEYCKAPIVAPMQATDLVSGVVITQPSQVTRAPAAGSTMSGGTVTVTGSSITLTFKSGANTVPFRSVGFSAQNGSGSLAKGSAANVKPPLLLQLEALNAQGVRLGMLRFWTYQGLKANTGDERGQFDSIGEPAEGMYETPAYLGIGTATRGNGAPPAPLITSLRITVLKGAITDHWTVNGITYTVAGGNKTCWSPEPGWRLISDPNEDQPSATQSFTHTLRTEAVATHVGHTTGRYWEFNKYGQTGTGNPDDVSYLQGSDASGGLITPAVQLRDIESLCDLHSQVDIPGLYHWSHFHLQGYHETEDYNPRDPDLSFGGFGGPGQPGSLYVQHCSANSPSNYYRDEIFVCDAYRECLTKGGAILNSTPLGVLVALGNRACGASCVQTMQVERDACAVPPAMDDERNMLYSLNNGRTWRNINHMKDRYHGGYPGNWHYYHAHPAQDSDGMLGMDDYYATTGNSPDQIFGHDWDRDDFHEFSTGDPTVDNMMDTQFNGGIGPDGLTIQSPAIRMKFEFRENASAPSNVEGWDVEARCVDANGDGHCAGWRIDDVAIDYDEECPAATKFYDSFEESNPGDFEIWSAMNVATICGPTADAIDTLLEENGECTVEPFTTDEQDIYYAMMERVTDIELMGMVH